MSDVAYIVVPSDYLIMEDGEPSIYIETNEMFPDLDNAERNAVDQLSNHPNLEMVVLDITPIKRYRAQVEVIEVSPSSKG